MSTCKNNSHGIKTEKNNKGIASIRIIGEKLCAKKVVIHQSSFGLEKGFLFV